MIAVVLAVVAVLALALMIAVEVRRLRASKQAKLAMRNRRPRRQPMLEDRVRPAFEGPRAQYGEIFVSYHVWRRENETRLELFSGPPWMKLNEFTRALIVRHLWRALEALVDSSVVVVDAPPQTWSQRVDASFDDRGVDPWAIARPLFGGDGPQYVRD